MILAQARFLVWARVCSTLISVQPLPTFLCSCTSQAEFLVELFLILILVPVREPAVYMSQGNMQADRVYAPLWDPGVETKSVILTRHERIRVFALAEKVWPIRSTRANCTWQLYNLWRYTLLSSYIHSCWSKRYRFKVWCRRYSTDPTRGKHVSGHSDHTASTR